MTHTESRAARAVMLFSFGWLLACAEAGDATQRAPLQTATAGSFAPGTAGTGAAGVGFAGTPGVAGIDAAGSGGGVAGSDAAGSGGIGSQAGFGGEAGAAGSVAGGGAGMNGMGGTGTCCADGDCLCHGSVPSTLSSADGPFKATSYAASKGTVHYPSDAEPPFAAIALCGGFTNTGPEMAGWGPFYASHGIVTIITTTTGADDPATRGTKLLAAIEELKAENTKSGSPLFGKLSGRYGTSGYSMGGGGTTIASGKDASLRTSVGLAAWGAQGSGVTVPTLLLCGTSDTTAACSMSQGGYSAIPTATPKMMISIQGATHFSWFGPDDAGSGTSGGYALAFQKVFLEGDERWKPLLLTKPANGTPTTNIQ
jgi:hypothetical protein